MAFDMVIRGGLVVDGYGGEPFLADVAIADGRIVQVATAVGPGDEEIDAKGSIVTPGFVDIHTHYDGQVIWEERFVPSTNHGVTTLVMGNCGFGFAPCHPADRETLINLMDGVEDIPSDVMRAGLKWSWETFPQYLDVLAQRQCDADFLALLPHGPLRVYVMGKRGVMREGASRADLIEMTRLVEEAIRAGALGVSTSHTAFHRTRDGILSPIETASEEELMALGRGMANAGAGLWELISTFNDIGDQGSTSFDVLKRVAAASCRPMSFTLLEAPSNPSAWRQLLKLLEAANREGLEIKGQVLPRMSGALFGLDLSFNPFSFHPSYKRIEGLPLSERVSIMRKPEFRAQILSEAPEGDNSSMIHIVSAVGEMFELGSPPNYEPPPAATLNAIAASCGTSPIAEAYDALLRRDGLTTLCYPMANYCQGSLDNVLTMMRDENTLIGLGDGGAHYGMVCDASYPTFVLTHWVRDREGDRTSLPWAIRRLTIDNARAIGLTDRGAIRTGLRADINVIDLDALHLHSPRACYDLPAGGRRLTQTADGYRATIVHGEVTYRDGVHTGTRPGRLVRAGAWQTTALHSHTGDAGAYEDTPARLR